MPAAPPPMMRADFLIVTSLVASGSRRLARATDIRTKDFALSVAASQLSEWIQEHWLRMLAISKR